MRGHGIAAIGIALASLAGPARAQDFTAVNWLLFTPAAGDVELFFSDLDEVAPTTLDLSGSDYAAAPLGSSAGILIYTTGSDWQLTLSEPVSALRLYVVGWRGIQGLVDPVVYQFDAPFAVLSGLISAGGSGGAGTLSLPDGVFHSGILEFDGPIAALSVDVNTVSSSAQAMTFALPEPSATGAAALALGMLLARSPRRRGRIA